MHCFAPQLTRCLSSHMVFMAKLRKPSHAAPPMKLFAEVPTGANSQKFASATGRRRALLVTGRISQKNLATIPASARGVTVRADALTTTLAGWVAGWAMKTRAMHRVSANTAPIARGAIWVKAASSPGNFKSVATRMRTRAIARRSVLTRVNALFTLILPANTRRLPGFAALQRRLDAWGCPRGMRWKAFVSGIRPTTTALPNLRILATCSTTRVLAKVADVAFSKVHAVAITPTGCPGKEGTIAT